MSQLPFKGVRLSDAARAAYCAYTGLTAAEADSQVAADSTDLARQWESFQAAHPGATLREFAAEALYREVLQMGAEMRPDLSPTQRERYARKITNEALRRSGSGRKEQ